MAEPGNGDELRRLQERIDRAKAAHAPQTQGGTSAQIGQAHAALRMVIELVTGLVMGVAMGYGLDALFGTRPVFLVVMTLLGFAAGINVMLRTAAEMTAKQNRDAADADARSERDEGRG